MIVLRNMTCAFLINSNDFLLMKRSENKKFAPGFWSGIGGHLESHEINNPQASCLREVYEETGIRETDITDFKLKYILLRRSKNEIRINHIYFGNSKYREVIETEEGKLFWIPKGEILDREYTKTIELMLVHYLETGYKINDVLVGSVSSNNNKPAMNWSRLQDWEK